MGAFICRQYIVLNWLMIIKEGEGVVVLVCRQSLGLSIVTECAAAASRFGNDRQLYPATLFIFGKRGIIFMMKND